MHWEDNKTEIGSQQEKDIDVSSKKALHASVIVYAPTECQRLDSLDCEDTYRKVLLSACKIQRVILTRKLERKLEEISRSALGHVYRQWEVMLASLIIVRAASAGTGQTAGLRVWKSTTEQNGSIERLYHELKTA